VLEDGTRIPLTHTPFTVGRGNGNDLVLLGLAVSLKHAEIRTGDGGFIIRDLGSRNGLVVSGTRVDAATLNAERPVLVGDIPLWLVETP
jgi:pSer/pThr/pTyr-binding forkhead associated (FHA) protein